MIVEPCPYFGSRMRKKYERRETGEKQQEQKLMIDE
jgi:hypothetical protein